MTDDRFEDGICRICGQRGVVLKRDGRCRMTQECDGRRDRAFWVANPWAAPEGYFGSEQRRRPSSAW